MRLPPQYDRFFIDGFFFLLCLSKSYLPNKITSQTRYTMMKIERNTIGRNFLSEKKSFLRVNYRQIDHDGADTSDSRRLGIFVAILSLITATRMMSPGIPDVSAPGQFGTECICSGAETSNSQTFRRRCILFPRRSVRFLFVYQNFFFFFKKIVLSLNMNGIKA